MSDCGGGKAPPGYTANLLATNAHLELLAAEGLTKETKIKVLDQRPPRDTNKCHAHLSLRATQMRLNT